MWRDDVDRMSSAITTRSARLLLAALAALAALAQGGSLVVPAWALVVVEMRLSQRGEAPRQVPPNLGRRPSTHQEVA